MSQDDTNLVRVSRRITISSNYHLPGFLIMKGNRDLPVGTASILPNLSFAKTVASGKSHGDLQYGQKLPTFMRILHVIFLFAQ